MTLVILRHGESEWNAKGLFCGWVDVNLSKSALLDTERSSRLITEYLSNSHIHQFDICYTSVLQRSIKTAHRILDSLHQLHIPHKKSWRLNERFYGELTGKNRLKMVEKYGKPQIKMWRRSYNTPPPPIDETNIYNPKNDSKYYTLSDFDINKDFPTTESLYNVIERIKPLWYNKILSLLKNGKNVLLCIHGTSMRAIIALIEKDIQRENINFETLSKLEIPNGYPIAYKFDQNGKVVIGEKDKWISKQQKVIKVGKIHGKFLGDLEELIEAQNRVKNQISNEKPQLQAINKLSENVRKQRFDKSLFLYILFLFCVALLIM